MYANCSPQLSFDAAGKDYEKFIYNRAGMLLALAIADKALFGFRSLDDLWEQEIPQGQDELILRFNDDALDRFIFRRWTLAYGIARNKMPKCPTTFVPLQDKCPVSSYDSI
jgi:hypothetical protein